MFSNQARYEPARINCLEEILRKCGDGDNYFLLLPGLINQLICLLFVRNCTVIVQSKKRKIVSQMKKNISNR